jgi:hypothetical protein
MQTHRETCGVKVEYGNIAVMILPTDNPLQIRDIFHWAVSHSYFHICQIFGKGGNREKTDLSYNEILDAALAEEHFKHFTIFHRKPITDYDMEHYEFGISSYKYFLEVRVRPELAQEIFKRYSLPLMPSTQVPEKDLKHTPDNPDDK